jgi:hypothetical protein
MSEKQKLTLSVNKDVIEKAKEMGINISEITENILKGFTFQIQGLTGEELYDKYQELFNVMIPLMKRFGFSVVIANYSDFDEWGKTIDQDTISLLYSGEYWSDNSESDFKDIKYIQLHWFKEPTAILSYFIENLVKGMESQKERLKEIEMAKRIVEVLSQTILSKEAKQ